MLFYSSTAVISKFCLFLFVLRKISYIIISSRHREISSDPAEKEKMISDAIIFQINRVILNSLSADISHLQKVEIDLNPRHEAFWFSGGINPTELVRKIRKGVKWQEGFADEPVDRPIQYLGEFY